VVGQPRRELWVAWDGGSARSANGTITIGRDPACEVSIHGDAGVSRRHAQLRLLPTSIKLHDLGSRNGTFIEGRRLTGAALLTGGELLRVGNTELRAFPTEVEFRHSLDGAPPANPAPLMGDVADTTISSNLFGGLLRDIARATLSNPSDVAVLVAEACDTAQHLAMAAKLSSSDAAIVADCAVREAVRGKDSSWLQRIFLLFSTARQPMPLDVARQVMKVRPEIDRFPEEELGGYVGVLAGLHPASAEARDHVAAVFRILTDHDDA
jgi:hypothetical protein